MIINEKQYAVTWIKDAARMNQVCIFCAAKEVCIKERVASLYCHKAENVSKRFSNGFCSVFLSSTF